VGEGGGRYVLSGLSISSEDGKYLRVYDGNWIEIINAQSGQGTGVVPAKVCKPQALAIANNGTSLTIANYNLERKDFRSGDIFRKVCS
jgi:hypothetical protein